MKYIFLINNTAGNGKYQNEKLGESIDNAAKKLSLDNIEKYYTKFIGDAFQYVSELSEKDAPYTLFACGGDGTLREIVNSVMKRSDKENFAVGIVPCGTGNDFVKSFTDPESFLDIEKQLSSDTKTIDVLKVDDDYCINLTNVGFDSSIAANMIKIKKFFGKLSYKAALLWELISYKKHQMQIIFDDKTIVDTTLLLFSAGNGMAYGGGYYAAPKACLDDGLVDICWVEHVSRRVFISAVGAYKAGKHLAEPYSSYVHWKRCKSLTISSSSPMCVCEDGEISAKDSVAIEVIEKAINFVIPKGTNYKNT